MISTKQHNGIVITDIKNNQLVKQLYIGYSMREAKKEFKNFLNTL